MKIQTVAQNLRNTIAGKEKYLAEMKTKSARLSWEQNSLGGSMGYRMAEDVVKYLEVNLKELRRILQDVESCVTQDVEQSWRLSPDRSGGQFTDEEINRAGEWR